MRQADAPGRHPHGPTGRSHVRRLPLPARAGTRADPEDLAHVRFSGWKAGAMPGPGRPAQASHPSRHRACEPEPTELQELHRLVLEASGLDPGSYQATPLSRRESACLRALGVKSSKQALEKLRQSPELVARALDALLIGVGGFFRDPGVMNALGHFLPGMARQQDGRLHAWSAACGCGAELYSLAILLDQAGLLDGSVLVGTDCRHTAVAEARRGVYQGHHLHHLPAAVRELYFRPVGTAWKVAVPSGVRMTWEVRNVLEALPAGRWDLILCRNLAIYLAPRANRALWNSLVSCLRPGGLLVVGRAERPSNPGLTQLDQCVYRKTVSSDD